ncbi:hypothetical protein AAKU52_000782 [Pedobacter sp. CG_S7]|uniref:hypothetical protein n=1 Tax=Pedobacter sp. CG_S7 TaxID=3143930 RepID=UPI0033917EC7
MKYIFTLWLSFSFLGGFAQQKLTSIKLIQFSGIITDIDSNRVVPYVTLSNLSTNEQRSANYKGYFSFVAHPGDTILYTAVGFTKTQIIIPQDLKENKYTAMVKMQSEIVYLPTLNVYPWATSEEFTKDFLSMKVADDDMEIAKKNLNAQSLGGMAQTLSRDAGEISAINWRLNHDRSLNKNMVQTNPLLNPFAWGKFMQQIFNGDKTRADN